MHINLSSKSIKNEITFNMKKKVNNSIQFTTTCKTKVNEQDQHQ